MSPLHQVLARVAHKDGAPFRQHAFAYLASRRAPVRLAVGLHRALPRPLARGMVSAFGWASALKTDLPPKPADIVTAGLYRNEERQFAALRRGMPGVHYLAVDLGRPALTRGRTWGRALRALASAEAHRTMRAAASGDDFLVAARRAETVGHWLGLRGSLERTGARAVLVSSDTNPYACALIARAREAGLRVAFVNHGHIPADGMPPLDVDLAILDGEALLDVYRTAGPVTADVVFRGSEGSYRPMRTDGLRGGAPTVGIFASLLVDWARLGGMLPALRTALGAARFVLRLHPNQAIRDPDWRRHVPLQPDDVVSEGDRVLLDDAARCDLVIAGNSSCHLSVLKHGVPALYLPGLDDVPHDFYRMLELGILASAESPADADPAAIAAFYEDEAWADRFTHFDAAYPGRDAELAARAADALRGLVS